MICPRLSVCSHWWSGGLGCVCSRGAGVRSPRGEGQLQAPSKHPHHTPPVVPAVSHSDPLPAARYHYLSLMDASGGHRKGQGTFVQRISSNFSGEKYISPAFCRAGWGRWAESRAPCSSLHLLHLSQLPHRFRMPWGFDTPTASNKCL